MKKTKPPKSDTVYRRIWRVVDGALADAFTRHPDYLTPKGRHGNAARISIAKRVTGAVKSFAEKSAQSRPRSQSGG